MRFIRDIIFDKRAARPTDLPGLAEDPAVENPAEPEMPAAAAMAPAAMAPAGGPLSLGPYRRERPPEPPQAEADALFGDVFDDEDDAAFAAEEPAVLLARPNGLADPDAEEPSEDSALDEMSAFPGAGADDGVDDDLDDDLDDAAALEDEAEIPITHKSFFDRLKRLEAQRHEAEAAKPAPEAATRPQDEPRLRFPRTAEAEPAPPRPTALHAAERRPAEPARPRGLDDMPFVTVAIPDTPEFRRLRPQATVPAPVTPVHPVLPREALPAAAAKRAEPAPTDLGIEMPPPAVGRGAVRTGRVKTRLLGFNPDEIAMADPFQRAESRTDTRFAVGWLVVVAGPGRGAAFALHDGVSKIGRGDDQTVALNFGDNAISRENHVAIAYDSETNGFYIGQSGRANIVRLNNKPLLSTEALVNHDRIRVGETTLMFVALCGDGFSWGEATGTEARHA